MGGHQPPLPHSRPKRDRRVWFLPPVHLQPLRWQPPCDVSISVPRHTRVARARRLGLLEPTILSVRAHTAGVFRTTLHFVPCNEHVGEACDPAADVRQARLVPVGVHGPVPVRPSEVSDNDSMDGTEA